MIRFHHKEFERDIRRKLNKINEPIYENDLCRITDLDCTNYDFDHNDIDILRRMYNLKSLNICIWYSKLDFLRDLSGLEILDLTYGNKEDRLDLGVFSKLQNLKELFISGGEVSGIDYENLDALVGLTGLKTLMFHEFGTVNLSSLRQMPWIEEFYCGYADSVIDIDAVGTLKNLKSLILIDLEIDNLSFLNSLSNDLSLELCGDNIISGIDWDSFNRFREIDICEMKINGEEIFKELFRREENS